MKNIEKYRKLLPELGLDGVLLTGRVNRRYCAQYDIMEAIALVTPTESRYFTDSRYIEAAEKNLPDFTVEMVDKDHSFTMLLRKAVEENASQWSLAYFILTKAPSVSAFKYYVPIHLPPGGRH